MPLQASIRPVSPARRRLLNLLHVMVIALSVVLIYAVTYDTLNSISLITDKRYLKLQFWICIIFFAETLIEWAITPGHLRNLPKTVLLLLLCVPYISIVHHFHWPVSLELYYILRVMPLVRAATVLVVMWGIMEKNRVTGLFGSYMIILLITLYVLSLMFYVEEHPVNSGVYNYWQSLWYSFMQMNTCGSNISPVTTAGKVIGVILSVEGLILFPVFTVYFTHAFGHTRATSEGAQ
ncbi:MAG: ion channel [Firmicutes bacterium]|nr:ion channel [Bacillota bacterium]MCM1400436.1 ion channel [Bacteroides sp.]MCM1476924.1 ion channel [Bacteroides sp.]